MHSEKLSNFGILVISSDKYHDLWDPFFDCLEKNWVDCPFDIYLGSNSIIPHEKFKHHVILSGIDKDWSTSAKLIINQIPKKYLLVIMEDFFIISKVCTEEVINHFYYMELNSINHMHFENIGLASDYSLSEAYNCYESGAPYRVNVFGFWKKDIFNELLLCGETPWEFEVMGSYRSKYFSNFLAIKSPPFQIINMVEKGVFFKESYNYCLVNKIDLSHSSRKLHNNIENIKSYFNKFIFNMVKKISWKKRLWIINILKKILIIY
jgi:hypothetical protein